MAGNIVSRFICRVLACAIMLSMLCAASAETVWGDLNARYANVPQLEYRGVRYRLKSRLTTILLAGTDAGAQNAQSPVLQYRNGGQADFLLLLAIDDAQKTITPIQIDRDTMTEITVVNVLGQVSGSRMGQICLAHSFGDGGETSCERLVSAVCGYLKGTPVDHYFVLNMEGISDLNDALGGVQVTLRHDFSMIDPEMTAGKTMVLTGGQAEAYVRERSLLNESNADRQLRQQEYMLAAKDALLAGLKRDRSFISDLRDELDAYITTDMGNARLINYSRSALDYKPLPVQMVAGEYQIGRNGFIEFIPDESSLMELVIRTFYVPMQ